MSCRLGRLVKVEDLVKSDFAAPGTEGERAADTPAQAADRARIAHQRALERKLVILQSKLESAWEYGDKAGERRLAEAIEQTLLELGAIRAVPNVAPDESVAKTESPIGLGRAKQRDALGTLLRQPTLRKGDLPDPLGLSNDLGLRSQTRIKD